MAHKKGAKVKFSSQLCLQEVGLLVPMGLHHLIACVGEGGPWQCGDYVQWRAVVRARGKWICEQKLQNERKKLVL